MADIPLQFPNIGNALQQGAHAGYFVAAARQKADEEQRRQDAQPYIKGAMGGDPNAMGQLASGDPRTAAVVVGMLGRMDAQKQAHVKAVADWSARASNAVLQEDPKNQPAMYERMKAEGQALGYDTSKLGPWDSSATPAMLRYQRGQSGEMLKLIEKQQEEQGRNARHNSPQATQTPSMEPMGGPAVPMAPPAATPAPVSPAGGRVSELSPGVVPSQVPTQAAAVEPPQPPVQTAQAAPGTAQGQATADYQPTGQSPGPLKPEGVTPGSPPAAQAGQQGAIWTADPTTQGGVMMGHRAKPGAPLLPAEVGGHFVYRLPDGRTVLYKPGADAGRKDISTDYADPEVQKVIQALPPITRANLNASMRAGDHKSVANILAQAQGGVPPELYNAHGDEFRQTPYWQGVSPLDRNVVEGLLNGSIPASTLSKRGGGGQGGVGGLPVNALYGLASQIDPAWSPNEGEQRKRFEASLVGNGQNAQNVAAINVVPRHAADLVRISDAINQKNPQLVNDIMLRLKSQFGDTQVPDLIAARNLSALEFLKAAVGPGALNQTLEKEFLGSIPLGATAAQVRQVVSGYVDKVLSRADVLQETADKYGIKDKGLILHPETQKYVDYLKGKTTDVGGPAKPAQPDPLEGQTATNPGTGAKIIRKNGQWVPVK